ncbi:MAG: hypothetical protein KGI80_01745 [Verrucomicrobiota bacterium]|nr:hypothetical protein [Verrucomicrobiota bacterium]
MAKIEGAGDITPKPPNSVVPPTDASVERVTQNVSSISKKINENTSIEEKSEKAIPQTAMEINVCKETPAAMAMVVYQPPRSLFLKQGENENTKSLEEEKLLLDIAAAERQYLNTYKALHTGGRETSESGLVLSVLTGVNFERPLLEEIREVLSEHFDLSATPIQSFTLLTKPERRNRVIRITLKNTETSIIFKESHAVASIPSSPPSEKDIADSYSRFTRDCVGLEFTSLLVTESPLCPKYYGGSSEYRFVLMQDLGKHVSLVDSLVLGTSETAAEASLQRFMICLGRFHAASYEKTKEYQAMLHDINPSTNQNNTEELIQNKIIGLKSICDSFDIPWTNAIEQEAMTALQESVNPEGPFCSLLHNDACPDNTFDVPDQLVLIDFEWASIGSALLDATYPRMNIPSGWCAGAIPEETLLAIENAYRDELKKQIPAATIDTAYDTAYTQACACHILSYTVSLIKEGLEEDFMWGAPDLGWTPTIRPRVLSHLQAFINISERTSSLPAFKSMTISLLEKLKKEWPEAKSLELYPAFTKN